MPDYPPGTPLSPSGKPSKFRIGKRRGVHIPPEREFEIMRQLALFTPEAVIVKTCAEKFGVHRNTIQNYLTGIWDRLARLPIPEKDAMRAAMNLRFSDFYGKALAARQFPAAVQALDRVCKLWGLYAPTEFRGSVTGEQPIEQSNPEAVRTRIRDVLKRHPELLPDGGASALTAEAAPAASPEPEGSGEEGNEP